jgi:hypothetical protein
MEELARMEISLIEDRGQRKMKTTCIKNGKMFGWIKPI